MYGASTLFSAWMSVVTRDDWLLSRFAVGILIMPLLLARIPSGFEICLGVDEVNQINLLTSSHHEQSLDLDTLLIDIECCCQVSDSLAGFALCYVTRHDSTDFTRAGKFRIHLLHLAAWLRR
jgi:hypothetical protein